MLELIARRYSSVRLEHPGPDLIELDQILTAAVAGPDHRRLRPWRFTVFTGESRLEFGDLLAQRIAELTPDQDPSRLARERDRLLRAPVVVAVGAVVEPQVTPAIEQVCAVAAAVQNLLLAATALGYGSIWRTGWACRDDRVKDLLELREQDYLLGFIYLGTPDNNAPAPLRTSNLDGVVRHWSASPTL